MNISRRSFLKLAGLTTVAVAVSASMTGCATPWTPSLTITYQEVAVSESVGLYTTSIKTLSKHEPWENGKKVAVSGEKFVTDIQKELDGYKTEDQIISKITAALKEDYPFNGKKITLVNAEPEINKSLTSYAVTIEFKVVDDV